MFTKRESTELVGTGFASTIPNRPLDPKDDVLASIPSHESESPDQYSHKLFTRDASVRVPNAVIAIFADGTSSSVLISSP